MELFFRMLQQTLDITETLDVLEREGRAAIAKRPVFAAHGKNSVRRGGSARRLDASLTAIRPFLTRLQRYLLWKPMQGRPQLERSFSSFDPAPVASIFA